MKRHGAALDRALSKLGYASRSQAGALIRAGKVAVNGRAVTNPLLRIDLRRDKVRVEGIRRPPLRWTLLALNKPRGSVTTRHDPEGRQTAYDFLTGIEARVVPVGRLDFASTGLLLFTNETQLANWLTDPESAVVRRYVVTVRGELTDESCARMKAGIDDDGVALQAASANVLKRSQRETHVQVALTEGRNREIRRMMKALGHEVTRLKRIAFGGIELGGLAPGRWRQISIAEARSAFPGAPIHG